jgi:hypothetical protein
MLQKLADSIFRVALKVFNLEPREKTPDWAILGAVCLMLMAGVAITYFQPWILGLIIAAFLVGGLLSAY